MLYTEDLCIHPADGGAALQGCLLEVLQKLECEGEGNHACEHMERLLHIYHTLVEHRGGAKITRPESVCEVSTTCVSVEGSLFLQVLQGLWIIV